METNHTIFLMQEEYVPRALEKIFGLERLQQLVLHPELRLNPEVSKAIRDAAVPTAYSSLSEVCKQHKDTLYKVSNIESPLVQNIYYGWSNRKVGAIGLELVDTSKLWSVRWVSGGEHLMYFDQPGEDNFLRMKGRFNMGKKKNKKGQNKLDWIIHLVANGEVCQCCGEVEDGFPDYICNAHTHGMEKYHHPDFQMVLRYSNEDICDILNELGRRVQAGERFHAGQMVSGIFTDCDVRLDEFEETDRTVLRVIIPDEQNRFPEEDDCNELFKMQLIATENLHRGCAHCY